MISKHDRTGHRLLLMAILLAGAALRLYQLSADSLWGDEIGTLIRASADRSLISVVLEPLTVPDIPQTPVFFLIAHLFLRMGESDFLLRFPSFFFGTVGIATTYAVGKRLWGPGVGLLAALLLALSPFHIRYSQEARYPTLVVFLSLLTLLFLLHGLSHKGLIPWVIFTGTTLLNIYTFLPTALVLGVEALYFVLIRFWKGLARQVLSREVRGQTTVYFVASVLVIILFSLPLLPVTLGAIRGPKGLAPSPAGEPLVPSPDYLLEIPAQWSAGRVISVILFGLAGIWGLAAAARKERGALVLAGLWLLVPFGIILGFPFQKDFRLRYLIFVLPFYLLIVARGAMAAGEWLASQPAVRRLLRQIPLAAGAGLMSILSIAALPGYYQEGKQQWQAVADYLQSHVRNEEVVVMTQKRFPYALHHYGYRGEVMLYSSDQSPPASGIWVVDIPWGCERAPRRVPWVADYRLIESASFYVPQEGITPLAAELIGPARYMPIFICNFKR